MIAIETRYPSHCSEDEEDVAECLHGDREAAWGRIVARYEIPLTSFLSKRHIPPDCVPDILQEVFASAVQHLPELRDSVHLKTWLFTSAIRRAISRMRMDRRKPFSLPDTYDTADTAPSLPVQVSLQERRDIIWQLLNKLPEIYRKALQRYYFDALTVDEMQTVMTGEEGRMIPIGTVKRRIC